MPRRAVKPEEPTLSAERAIPALEQLITQASEVKLAGRGNPRKREWANEAEAVLSAALGGDNSLVNAFKRDFSSGWNAPHDSEQRLQNQFERQIDGGNAALKAAVRTLRLRLLDDGQVFLPAGSQHDAYSEIRKILSEAKVEVLIVDPYVDESLWVLLTNLGSTVKARILTQNMKGDFVLEAKKFTAQHKLPIEIRTTNTYHDRFLVLDGGRAFHLGASIKDAGSKATMISEIFRSQIAAATVADIETEWTKSVVVL